MSSATRLSITPPPMVATLVGDAPYDAWLDVIGVVSTEARDRGQTTGEQFTAIVRDKARAQKTVFDPAE